jgi:hypothetical protein
MCLDFTRIFPRSQSRHRIKIGLALSFHFIFRLLTQLRLIALACVSRGVTGEMTGVILYFFCLFFAYFLLLEFLDSYTRNL